jgi:hypothetical protein
MTYSPPPPVIWTTIVKLVDEDVASSIVEQDDDELQFAVDANSIYHLELEIVYSTAAGSSPDFKMGIAGPTSCVGSYHAMGVSTTDAVQHTAGGISSGPASITFGAGIAKRIILIFGEVTIDSTSGSVKLRWCQNSSNATATRVHAGSRLRYRKVPV